MFEGAGDMMENPRDYPYRRACMRLETIITAITTTLFVLFILYCMWGFVSYRVVANVDFPEISWSIVENDSENIKKELAELHVNITKEERVHHAYAKVITLYLDDSLLSTDENINKIMEILLQSGYEDIKIGNKNNDNSFRISGRNGRREIHAVCSSNQLFARIHIEVHYNRMEILKWTIQKYLFE